MGVISKVLLILTDTVTYWTNFKSCVIERSNGGFYVYTIKHKNLNLTNEKSIRCIRIKGDGKSLWRFGSRRQYFAI